MFESFGVLNFWALLKNISVFASSIILAELYDRFNIKTVLTFQKGVTRIRKNIVAVSKKMKRKGSSGVILNLGKRIYHLHHSRVGIALIGAAVLFSNISLLVFSLGLVLHHAIRERKLF